MYSARIYSTEALQPQKKEAFSDGLEIFGQYLGGISINKFSIVSLPSQANGKVKPDRVGYKQLDKFIDFHIFVAPLDLDVNKLGLSRPKTGISWIQSALDNSTATTTIAHEVAHSAGFVLPDSPQYCGGGHCSSSSCIMHYTLSISTADLLRQRIKNIDNLVSEGFLDSLNHKEQKEDFCTPCKADIRDTGEQNMSQLRHMRVVTGRIV